MKNAPRPARTRPSCIDQCSSTSLERFAEEAKERGLDLAPSPDPCRAVGDLVSPQRQRQGDRGLEYIQLEANRRERTRERRDRRSEDASIPCDLPELEKKLHLTPQVPLRRLKPCLKTRAKSSSKVRRGRGKPTSRRRLRTVLQDPRIELRSCPIPSLLRLRGLRARLPSYYH